MSFSSKYRLNAHKKSTGHLRKRGRSSSSVGQKKQCNQSILKRYYEQNGDQPCAEEGSEELESVQLRAEEGSEDLDEDKDNSDNDLSENCMVCGQKEDDDKEVEDWVACEACSQWIHAKCIPVDHPFSLEDPDFYCHNCIC